MELKNSLKSCLDQSVNFIFDNYQEARFVRRVDDYFIIYLSSHNGCNKACRFCHLTQSGQTDFEEASIEDYVLQAKTVFEYYDTLKTEKAKKVHFNFMSRGEFFANKVSNEPNLLFDKLDAMAKERGLNSFFAISTIMPEEVKEKDLSILFKDVTQDFGIYYSIYSTESKFRKKWLNKSIDVNLALEKLKQLQLSNDKPVIFHFAFIDGENDSVEQVNNMIDTIKKYDLKAKFNIVRYNPYSENQGKESSEEIINRNFVLLNNFFKNNDSRIVPKVGFDVKASCGMFVLK